MSTRSTVGVESYFIFILLLFFGHSNLTLGDPLPMSTLKNCIDGDDDDIKMNE